MPRQEPRPRLWHIPRLTRRSFGTQSHSSEPSAFERRQERSRSVTPSNRPRPPLPARSRPGRAFSRAISVRSSGSGRGWRNGGNVFVAAIHWPSTDHRFPARRASASGWCSFPIPLRGSSGFSPDSLPAREPKARPSPGRQPQGLTTEMGRGVHRRTSLGNGEYRPLKIRRMMPIRADELLVPLAKPAIV